MADEVYLLWLVRTPHGERVLEGVFSSHEGANQWAGEHPTHLNDHYEISPCSLVPGPPPSVQDLLHQIRETIEKWWAVVSQATSEHYREDAGLWLTLKAVFVLLGGESKKLER